MKGALCKVKLVEGRLSSFDEDDETHVTKSPTLSVIGDTTFDTGDVNANSTKGVGPIRPLCEALSPDGLFAYCGLLTEALTLLFTDAQQDKDFAEATLKRFTAHIDLPSSTCIVMEMTLRGESGSCGWKNFLVLLKEEVLLTRSFVPLVQDLMIFSVQGGSYDARTRVLINHLSSQLGVPSEIVELIEETVVGYLTDGQMLLSPEAQEKEEKYIRTCKYKRYALIGIATVSGGALLGLTGGLAAPLIGAGLGTIIGAGGATVITSTAGIAVVSSLFGAAGAGLTGYKMKKRVGELEEFSFQRLTEGSSLHITICICGWLTEDSTDAYKKPWQSLHHSAEQYCLLYESKYLLEMGKAMDMLVQFALSVAVQESLKFTILSGIISAITWPSSLLTLASMIDNPWSVCLGRSAEAGRQLALALLQRYHGRRPVTLIGFSLGARAIYYCLQELSQRDGSAGIIEDAILLGAPVSGNASDWSKFGTVVSGRIINGYCKTDWLLRFLYRTSSASLKIAGLQAIDWKDRRMFNFNLSAIVKGHADYAKELEIILKTLGIRTKTVITSGIPDIKKSQSEMVSTKCVDHVSLQRRSTSCPQLGIHDNHPFALSDMNNLTLQQKSKSVEKLHRLIY